VLIGGNLGIVYVQVLLNQNELGQEAWQVVEKCCGTIHMAACCDDITSVITLTKPVKLYANNLYAIRLVMQVRLVHTQCARVNTAHCREAKPGRARMAARRCG
jgi:hypothetical protein